MLLNDHKGSDEIALWASRDSELSKQVFSDESFIAAALLKRQQFLRCAKRYAGSSLTVVGCIAVTHSLYMEHNVLQTGSGREEAQERVGMAQLT